MSRAALAAAYLRTRALQVLLRDRDAIERHQRRGIEAQRRHAVAHTAFYRDLGDAPFADWPIVDKATVMARFADFNVLDLSADDGWRVMEGEGSLSPSSGGEGWGEGRPPAQRDSLHVHDVNASARGSITGVPAAAPHPPFGHLLPLTRGRRCHSGYDVGCSTGTSGNRGLYIVSDAERFTWLGTIVAKALPDVWRRRHRVAVVLPRTSRLYAAANESRLLQLLFVDIGQGLDAVARALETFRPTVVVAPPKLLRHLAETAARIAPERLYSAAEVLDPPDRTRIEAAFGLRLGEIYMATEGLFGVSCAHGTLHLAEDVVHFELEPVGDGLVSPIVTDFARRTQVMARYRMNDLLRLASAPCPCGSPLRAVAEVVGRRDDAFELPAVDGAARRVLVTPDVLRNAVLGADRSIDDFRLRQTGERAIELVLTPRVDAGAAEAAWRALAYALRNAGVIADIALRFETLSADGAAKLRRVERRWRPPA